MQSNQQNGSTKRPGGVQGGRDDANDALLAARLEMKQQAEQQTKLLAAMQQHTEQFQLQQQRWEARDAANQAQMAQQTQLIQALMAGQQRQPSGPVITTPVSTAKPTAAESAAIKEKVAVHVKAGTRQLNDYIHAVSAVQALRALELDADHTVPLPARVPKEALKIKAPQLQMRADLAETRVEELKSANAAVAGHIRAAQIAFVAQTIVIKEEEIKHLEAKRPQAVGELRADVTAILDGTLIEQADKERLLATAAASYEEQMRAVTIKIETRRKAADLDKKRKAELLEAERLKQLETDNSTTLGALMDSKIAANNVRRGSEEITAGEIDQIKLMEENAAFEKEKDKLSKTKPKNGKASRAQPLATRGQNNTTNGKGKGKQNAGSAKGKGKSKGAGGKGGR